jgi:hypothetical protein
LHHEAVMSALARVDKVLTAQEQYVCDHDLVICHDPVMGVRPQRAA